MAHRPITPADMDDAQRALHHAILTGPRRGVADKLVLPDGSLVPPFGPMLLAPRLGGPLQEIGAELRYGGGLPDDVRELAILVVAVAWSAQGQWNTHHPLAVRAGVPPDVLEAVRDGQPPPDDDSLLGVVCSTMSELLDNRAISEPTMARLERVLDEPARFELVVLCGYYSALAMIMAAAGMAD